MESITPELIDMTDEEAMEFLRKRAEGTTAEKDPLEQRAHFSSPVCALCEADSPDN